MSLCTCTQTKTAHGSGVTGAFMPTRFTHRRSFVQPVSRHDVPIQAKLTVGAPGDRYEQEADRVADQVMRMSADNAATLSAPPQIQRLCAGCEDELQRQVEEEEEEEEMLQTKPQAGVPNRAVTSDVSAQVHSLRGGGQPLPKSTRAFFEPRFGHDFSQVRVHADHRAASSAQALNARAYTSGRDIAFAASQYAPESQPGKHLLAHELTHVVQQSGGSGGAPRIQRTLGDGHDLTATRFSGNAVLEAAYDDERLIRRGHSGAAVRLIQESLLAQGYTLPNFGADGIFGAETDTAVREFQIDAGAVKLDGIVGPETMKLLDMHDTGTTATTGPAPIPPATGAVFSEHPQEQFAGYDDTTVPNDSLVVPTNGRRQARVAIAPAPAVPAYVSANPAVATTEPTPDGVAITGVSDGPTRIEVREGATVLDALEVNVKDRVDHSVAFHYVCDSRPAAAGGPHCSNGTPSADSMRSLLNRVWERQANVRFTGGASANIVAAGDLGHAVDGHTVGPEPEIAAVTANSLGADYNVFRVWHHHVDGAHTNDASNLGNETIIGNNPCADGLGLPHEAGHFLSVDHPDGFLMTPCPGARTRRIGFAIANRVNP